MLSQPLLAKLRQLGLTGFQAALEEQQRNSQYAELSFEDRLGMMIDRECLRRQDNSLRRRIKAAGFALPASLEDLDFSPRRGLTRSLILELAQGEWIHRCLNVVVLGPTGAGKSYLACTLGHTACRQDYSVRYERTSRLLHELMLSHADGSYLKMLHTCTCRRCKCGLSRVKLLICDDWLRDPLTLAQARDLLEILDDRYGRSSTLVATQIPVEEWHARIPDPTLADAVLDRLVHNAYRLELKGDSMRKPPSPLQLPAS